MEEAKRLAAERGVPFEEAPDPGHRIVTRGDMTFKQFQAIERERDTWRHLDDDAAIERITEALEVSSTLAAEVLATLRGWPEPLTFER